MFSLKMQQLFFGEIESIVYDVLYPFKITKTSEGYVYKEDLGKLSPEVNQLVTIFFKTLESACTLLKKTPVKYTVIQANKFQSGFRRCWVVNFENYGDNFMVVRVKFTVERTENYLKGIVTLCG